MTSQWNVNMAEWGAYLRCEFRDDPQNASLQTGNAHMRMHENQRKQFVHRS